MTFYYRILADATIGTSRPAALYGLAVFTKRAVLCGEDSSTHIYRSDTRLWGADGASRLYANRPTAVVEITDTNSQRKTTHSSPNWRFAVSGLFLYGFCSAFDNIAEP